MDDSYTAARERLRAAHQQLKESTPDTIDAAEAEVEEALRGMKAAHEARMAHSGKVIERHEAARAELVRKAAALRDQAQDLHDLLAGNR